MDTNFRVGMHCHFSLPHAYCRTPLMRSPTLTFRITASVRLCQRNGKGGLARRGFWATCFSDETQHCSFVVLLRSLYFLQRSFYFPKRKCYLCSAVCISCSAAFISSSAAFACCSPVFYFLQRICVLMVCPPYRKMHYWEELHCR